MSKKSRRQRQRSKQRNYAQVYNQPARPDSAETAPAKASSTPAFSPTTAPSSTLIRMQVSKNADLWDSLIFAGAIFVVFIAIYYINLRSPFLPQFGIWVTNLFGFSL